MKNELISLRILALMADGKSTQEAFDTVLGTGAYQKLAGEVYDTLKAKPQKIKKPSHDMARRLTVEEVSEIFRVSKPTIRRWAKDGVIPSVKVSRKLILFEYGDLEAALSPK